MPETESTFARAPVARVNVLGVGLSSINLQSVVPLIFQRIESAEKGYVCVTGVHGVSEAQSDAVLRGILNGAFLNTPDGMPMTWMGRAQGDRHIDRVYGPDLMLAVCEQGEPRGIKHFLYGGKEGVADLLAEKLRARFPKIEIVGSFCPPFRPLEPQEKAELIARLEALAPDIIWVGLSTPKQERFMAEYLPQVNTKLMFGVGAAFDFHAGLIPQAPRWMQRAGMEWFYRLTKEPKRLWKRYFKNNPLFIGRAFLQLTRLKKYRLTD